MMVISTAFYMRNNSPSMDVAINCPLCDRRSHLKISGKKKVDAVSEYLTSSHMLTQDLPLVSSEREFLRSGYCRECLSMFGEPSKNIRYVRKQINSYVGKE